MTEGSGGGLFLQVKKVAAGVKIRGRGALKEHFVPSSLSRGILIVESFLREKERGRGGSRGVLWPLRTLGVQKERKEEPHMEMQSSF